MWFQLELIRVNEIKRYKTSDNEKFTWIITTGHDFYIKEFAQKKKYDKVMNMLKLSLTKKEDEKNERLPSISESTPMGNRKPMLAWID